MIKAANHSLIYYEFENLKACHGIQHRIFTRNGGFSRAPFASLNVAFGVGDKHEHIHQNRNKIRRSIDAVALIFANQVHGDQVAVLKGEDNGQSRNPIIEAFTADAIVTDRPGWYPVMQVADCQAVLLFEPVRSAVANIHCGWRGSIQNVIGRTVDAMIAHFKCDPEQIQAGIGPSLGPCCAEFVNFKAEIPEVLWQYKDDTHHFDFWLISAAQLANAGVPDRNIEIGRICTRCSTNEFFSYRAEKITGRFAAVIGLI